MTGMLFGGAYISYRLLKELLRRTTGVPADWSTLTTVFTLGAVASALHRIAAPVLRALRPRPTLPSAAGALFAVAVPLAILRRITGLRTTDAPLVGSVIAVGLMVPALRAVAALVRMVPAVFGSVARVATGRSYGR